MTTPSKAREKPVKSPCVSLCALDINDICMGCQRVLEGVVIVYL